MKTKKEVMIEMYKSGISMPEIVRHFKTYNSDVTKTLKDYLNKKDPNIFNVYEIDCWIVPSKNN
jgi:hypothetical protein